MAVLYGIIGLLFTPLFLLSSFLAPEEEAFPLVLSLLFPVLYIVLTYLFTALAAVFYNWVAGWAGGIELTLRPSEEREPLAPPA